MATNPFASVASAVLPVLSAPADEEQKPDETVKKVKTVSNLKLYALMGCCGVIAAGAATGLVFSLITFNLPVVILCAVIILLALLGFAIAKSALN